jgi:hypothetical protein
MKKKKTETSNMHGISLVVQKRKTKKQKRKGDEEEEEEERKKGVDSLLSRLVYPHFICRADKTSNLHLFLLLKLLTHVVSHLLTLSFVRFLLV